MPADLSWPFSYGQLGLFSRNPCVFLVLLCFECWQVLWEVEANPASRVSRWVQEQGSWLEALFLLQWTFSLKSAASSGVAAGCPPGLSRFLLSGSVILSSSLSVLNTP